MRLFNDTVSHPSDGELIRYLDRQLALDERRGMMAHLSGCDECTDRLGRLGAQASAVSGMLARLDEGVAVDELTRARALHATREAAQRSGVRRSTWFGAPLRAAAAIAVLVLTGFTVEPVRAWVVERWGDLKQVLAPTPEAPVLAEAPAPVLEHGSLVSFAPVGDVFVLEIKNEQAAGSVTIELRDVERATAQIIDGGEETILVLPSGLQVENEAGSTASYAVTLPGNLRLVQVFAGGIPVAILPTEGLATPWTRTIPLQQ